MSGVSSSIIPDPVDSSQPDPVHASESPPIDKGVDIPPTIGS